MAALMQNGVRFENSHAVFPTFTTANASTMATGHLLGDTGDFSNTVYSAFRVPAAKGSVTPFLENDAVLGQMNQHCSGNYFNEETIFADVATKAVLPLFARHAKPFALVFWSRDPDGTQHNQGDSLLSLKPGIDGPTSQAAVRNADDDLRQLMAALRTYQVLGGTYYFDAAGYPARTVGLH